MNRVNRTSRASSFALLILMLSGAFGCAEMKSTRSLTYTGENGKSVTVSEVNGALATTDSHISADYALTDSADGSSTLTIHLGSEGKVTTENQATVWSRAIEALRYVAAAAFGYMAGGGVKP